MYIQAFIKTFKHFNKSALIKGDLTTTYQVLNLKLFGGFHPELLLLGKAANVDVLAGILESQVLDLVGKLLLVGNRKLQVGVDEVLGNLKKKNLI